MHGQVLEVRHPLKFVDGGDDAKDLHVKCDLGVRLSAQHPFLPPRSPPDAEQQAAGTEAVGAHWVAVWVLGPEVQLQPLGGVRVDPGDAFLTAQSRQHLSHVMHHARILHAHHASLPPQLHGDGRPQPRTGRLRRHPCASDRARHGSSHKVLPEASAQWFREEIVPGSLTARVSLTPGLSKTRGPPGSKWPMAGPMASRETITKHCPDSRRTFTKRLMLEKHVQLMHGIKDPDLEAANADTRHGLGSLPAQLTQRRWVRLSLTLPGWSAVATESWLTATSAFHVQAILLPQPPE
ncbi:Zinc finger protein 532 [Plecturocebus cupreus]